jgi:hypothetical protein
MKVDDIGTQQTAYDNNGVENQNDKGLPMEKTLKRLIKRQEGNQE